MVNLYECGVVAFSDKIRVYNPFDEIKKSTKYRKVAISNTSHGYCFNSTTKDLAVTIIYNFRGIFIVLTIHSSDFKVRLLKAVRSKLINQQMVVVIYASMFLHIF